jgi:hypothetical protein
MSVRTSADSKGYKDASRMRTLDRALLLIGLLILLNACSGSDQQGDHLVVSWAVLYHDLSSLKRASDLAVVGTITAIAAQDVEDNIPFTDFRFGIGDILYSPHPFQGSTLIVHQTGGLLNGKEVSVEDDSLFQIGEEAILFLRQLSPGHYAVAGGPSGRFRLHNGLVTPITDEGVRLNWPLTEQEFRAALARA